MGYLRRKHKSRAAAMVEMALVLPVLVLLLFGVIEYGWMFLKISQVNNAARQGVRIAVRPDATTTDVSNAVKQVMQQAGLDKTGYQATVWNMTGKPGDPTSVQVSFNYRKVSLLGGTLIPVPDQLTGKATMAKEGPPTTQP